MKKNKNLNEEKGFALISCIMVLLALTLLGIMGLNTSTTEIQISGNLQQYQKAFNISEGGANTEATLVGFTGRSEYNISDPLDFPKELTTADGGQYDDPQTWPETDIFGNTASLDAAAKYHYFTTYLYPDAPPPGYSVNDASSYKFRINGNRDIIIELGGEKIGVPLF